MRVMGMRMRFVGCWRYLLILRSVRSLVSATQQSGSVLLIAACIVVLQACAVAPERSALVDVEDDLNGEIIPDEFTDLKEGDMVQSRTGMLAKFGTFTVGRQYSAASGRSCKQILDASGEQLLSVACQLPTKQWYVRESLHVAGNAGQIVPVKTDLKQLLVPVEQQTVEIKPAIEDKQVLEEPVSFRLKENETLYSFARRTTGNALNWQEIAEYNEIENELELSAGTALKIPVALQSAER